MAQKKGTQGTNRLARRFGGLQKTQVIVSGIVLALVVGALGMVALRAGLAPAEGLVIERAGQGTEAPPAEQEEAQAPQEQEDPAVVVHVDGAVASPGVYELRGSVVRMADAVEAAGGLLDEADTTSLNLAAPVTDGSKVYVPAKGDEAAANADVSGAASASGSATGQGTSVGTSAGTSVQTGLVNINTADVSELQTLSGVGEATANAIVQEREQGGPFSSVEDIMRVSGKGEKKFQKI